MHLLRVALAATTTVVATIPALASGTQSGDLNCDGVVNGADIGLLLLQWGPSPDSPVPTSVTPSTGPYFGGIFVTISGSGLCGVEHVLFDGTPAPTVTADSDTQLVAEVPAGKIGTATITLVRGASTADVPGGFEYLNPIPWADVLAVAPDPTVVPSPELRNAIVATQLPWLVRDLASQIEMVLIPPGVFVMGDDAAGGSEQPAHQVTLTSPYYLGRTEVTQEQYYAIIGGPPSCFSGTTLPIQCQDFNRVRSFVGATGLRLPTEAEWERACRAGSTASQYGPLNDIAWWSGNCSSPQGVGLKTPNGFGLYDMLGNVHEWVADGYYAYTPASQVDPFVPGWPSVSFQMYRGGSWFGSGFACRASWRNWMNVSDSQNGSSPYIGFRVARTP